MFVGVFPDLGLHTASCGDSPVVQQGCPCMRYACSPAAQTESSAWSPVVVIICSIDCDVGPVLMLVSLLLVPMSVHAVSGPWRHHMAVTQRSLADALHFTGLN